MSRFSNVFFVVIVLSLMVVLVVVTDSDDLMPNAGKAPSLLELQVIPATLTIDGSKRYPNPFTVMAQYSDATAKEITDTIVWASASQDLVDFNEQGELMTTGRCAEKICSAKITGTDPASGKSVEVRVNFPSRTVGDEPESKKKA